MAASAGTHGMHGEGWDPWVRALTPSEVLSIAQDLDDISDAEVRQRLPDSPYVDRDLDVEYAVGYLRRARVFATNLADEGRGMVYLIG